MKTNLLKKAAMAGVFALAVSGAVATQAQTLQKKAFTTKPGWVRGATPFICNNEHTCNIESTDKLCRIGDPDTGVQLYGKDAQGRCIETLWRVMP
jgi:hypothetical protein